MDIKELISKYKIKQVHFCRLTKETFKEQIISEYKLSPYKNKNKPVIFLGCNYNTDRLLIKDHKSIGIVLWFNEQLNGKKSKSSKNKEFLNEIKHKKNLIHYLITDIENLQIKSLYSEINQIDIGNEYINDLLEIKNNDYEFTLFYPETISWNYMKQRPQHIIQNLSKQNILIYYLDKKINTYEIVENNLYLINPTLFYKLFVNKKLNIFGKLVFYYSQSSFVKYIDVYKPDFVVYDYVDNDDDEFSHWAKFMEDVVSKANIVSFTAELLGEKIKTYYNFKGNTKLIPNACNPEDFSKTPDEVPSDLEKFRKEHDFIIGYYGAIAKWMDIDLINKISSIYPIVIIGKRSKDNGYQTITIKENSNILFLEAKPYNELYKYSYYFDACIIPFKLTKMINCCDPCKFYEYISMGKPVISTKMQPLIRFKEICHFIDCDNIDDVINNLKNDVENKEYKEKIIEISKQNTWFQRSIDLYNFIIENLN